MTPFQIRFDGPPGANPGRFLDIENLSGVSIWLNCVQWRRDRSTDSQWLLVIEPQADKLLLAYTLAATRQLVIDSYEALDTDVDAVMRRNWCLATAYCKLHSLELVSWIFDQTDRASLKKLADEKTQPWFAKPVEQWGGEFFPEFLDQTLKAAETTDMTPFQKG